jgi:hypothetical protein
MGQFRKIICDEHLWGSNYYGCHPWWTAFFCRFTFFQILGIDANTIGPVSCVRELMFPHQLSIRGGSVIDKCIQTGPPDELSLPVCYSRQWNADQKWTTDMHSLYQKIDKCCRLQRLPEPHLRKSKKKETTDEIPHQTIG